MGNSYARLTVMFEEPFWIGLYEREDNGRYEVCKIVFGAEPKDGEVYDYLLKNWGKLRFSPSVDAKMKEERRINPKRMQRQISRQIDSTGVGTKAQQALKLMQEQGKQQRKARTAEQREQEKRAKYNLHEAKLKKKHKGH